MRAPRSNPELISELVLDCHVGSTGLLATTAPRYSAKNVLNSYLILTNNDIQAKTLQMKKHFIVAALKDQLGDQKMDVLIRANSDLNKDIFLQDIFEQAIPLQLFSNAR